MSTKQQCFVESSGGPYCTEFLMIKKPCSFMSQKQPITHLDPEILSPHTHLGQKYPPGADSPGGRNCM